MADAEKANDKRVRIPVISFKRGMHELNEQPNYNFQLNRVINWDGGRLEDVEKVSAGIRSSSDWKHALISLGDEAMKEGRTENAIAYYRMSEFFMYDGDPDKLLYYNKATRLFYEHHSDYFNSGLVERLDAPYENVMLPIMHVRAQGRKKDTVLLHGGNDSYFEELFFPMLYLARNGFEVYLYEGPGQGGVLRVQGKKFTHQWEKPTKAVLDAIGETDVTIMGASLGGMLAPRAAAFEKRIKRVIGWSIFPNFLHVALRSTPSSLRGLMLFMMKHNMRGAINSIMGKNMKRNEALDWGVRHGMYAYDAPEPFDYIKKLDDFKMTDVGHRITQDVLILGADKDHFIDAGLCSEEMDALPNVHSLTFRLFTSKEDAGNHCNVGNPKLVLDTVMRWIEGVKAESMDGRQ